MPALQQPPSAVIGTSKIAHTMSATSRSVKTPPVAYVLLCALRRIGLRFTQFANATCGTIRLRLLKVGALVTTSVRRIKVAMASAYPWRDEWELAHAFPRAAGGR